MVEAYQREQAVNLQLAEDPNIHLSEPDFKKHMTFKKFEHMQKLFSKENSEGISLQNAKEISPTVFSSYGRTSLSSIREESDFPNRFVVCNVVTDVVKSKEST